MRLFGNDDTSSDDNKGLEAHFKRNGEEACCALCAAFVDDEAALNLARNRGAKMRLCCILFPTQCAALLAAGVVERTVMVSPGLLCLWLGAERVGWIITELVIGVRSINYSS